MSDLFGNHIVVFSHEAAHLLNECWSYRLPHGKRILNERTLMTQVANMSMQRIPHYTQLLYGENGVYRGVSTIYVWTKNKTSV